MFSIATMVTVIYHLWLTKNMRGLVEMDRGFCGDGSESVQGQAGMGVKSVGMGGDETKIPSLCTPLLRTPDSHCVLSWVLSGTVAADMVFLKAWIPVTVPQLYNPVTSLLLPIGAKDVWRGMKTVGELKRERGIQNTVNQDQLYRVFWIRIILFSCVSYIYVANVWSIISEYR